MQLIRSVLVRLLFNRFQLSSEDRPQGGGAFGAAAFGGGHRLRRRQTALRAADCDALRAMGLASLGLAEPRKVLLLACGTSVAMSGRAGRAGSAGRACRTGKAGLAVKLARSQFGPILFVPKQSCRQGIAVSSSGTPFQSYGRFASKWLHLDTLLSGSGSIHFGGLPSLSDVSLQHLSRAFGSTGVERERISVYRKRVWIDRR